MLFFFCMDVYLAYLNQKHVCVKDETHEIQGGRDGRHPWPSGLVSLM